MKKNIIMFLIAFLSGALTVLLKMLFPTAYWFLLSVGVGIVAYYFIIYFLEK